MGGGLCLRHVTIDEVVTHLANLFAMRCLAVSVVTFLPGLLLTALAAECPGKENTNKPWVGTPTLVQTVANGSLYTAGDGDDQVFGEGNTRSFTLRDLGAACYPGPLGRERASSQMRIWSLARVL